MLPRLNAALGLAFARAVDDALLLVVPRFAMLDPREAGDALLAGFPPGVTAFAFLIFTYPFTMLPDDATALLVCLLLRGCMLIRSRLVCPLGHQG